MKEALLRTLLESRVGPDTLPGAVALVDRSGRTDVEAVGHADIEGKRTMKHDAIFRIASVTKPILAAATMMLVDDGVLGLEDPVDRWLPELANRQVVRTPRSPLDEVVPARRPITVFDLLSFRSGYGFAADFSLPAVAPLFASLGQGPPEPQKPATPDEWMSILADIPLLYQPGEAWLYNTGSDVLGVLISRAMGRPLPEVLKERLFDPLCMADTGFCVNAGNSWRMSNYYRHAEGGGLELVDAANGQWASPPAFPSGAGGLVSTAGDLLAFGRLLHDGGMAGSRRLLTGASVERMMTNQLNASQRQAGSLFLEGAGWGLGGAVDVDETEAWNVLGRFGWVGGTGTAFHVCPSTGLTTILLTQIEMDGPTTPQIMRDFWTAAASA